jgi:hypothetical protein
MPKKERVREPISNLASPDYLTQRAAAGWKLVALEWEREGGGESAEPKQWVEDIPYGLQVSEDGLRLVENPAETGIIVLALDMIVEDCPLSQVASELNKRGFRMRDGKQWTPAALFSLLPRMIDVGPRVFSSAEWMTRKQRLPRAV